MFLIAHVSLCVPVEQGLLQGNKGLNVISHSSKKLGIEFCTDICKDLEPML